MVPAGSARPRGTPRAGRYVTPPPSLHKHLSKERDQSAKRRLIAGTDVIGLFMLFVCSLFLNFISPSSHSELHNHNCSCPRSCPGMREHRCLPVGNRFPVPCPGAQPRGGRRGAAGRCSTAASAAAAGAPRRLPRPRC